MPKAINQSCLIDGDGNVSHEMHLPTDGTDTIEDIATHRVRDTSLEAYAEILPHRRTMREEVFACIKRLNRTGPCCDRDVADEMGIPINRITPRRNELAKEGRIREAKDKLIRDGRRVTGWEAV